MASFQFCGGETFLSVFVASCPVGQQRFGDHCYFEASAADQTISTNEDLCAEKVTFYELTELSNI